MNDLFADLDTDPMASAPSSMEEVRKLAHAVHGGEATHTVKATELFPCPRCNGTGFYRGYGHCFKCEGSGKVSKAKAAAAKAKATHEQNEAARREEARETFRAELEYVMRRAGSSDFYASMLRGFDQYNRFTDRQLEIIHRDMAQDDQKRAEWKSQREAKGGQVDVSAIHALFATATDNDIKRPVFRAVDLTISKAPAHGANAGALYVKNGETYLGKIVGDQFHASRDAGPETLGLLQMVAEDPTAEAIKYARRTGRCGCCGHTLVDPVSIRAGIGPICAENWGLDYRREEARESLRAEG